MLNRETLGRVESDDIIRKIAFPRGAVRIGAIVAFAVLWLAIVWGAGRATLPAQILAGVSIMVVTAGLVMY